AVNASLRDIGILSGASRAYLFLMRDGEPVLDNTHEWCADGVSPQIENLQNQPDDMAPWWMGKLRRGEIIHIADVTLLPLEARAEKEFLQAQEIRSLIVLPLHLKRKLAGFIGFDNVTKTGHWSGEDVELLLITADIIGSALERRRAEEALRRSRRELSLILDSMPLHLVYHDTDLRIRYANVAAADSVGERPAALNGRYCHEVWHGRADPCPDCPVTRARETGCLQEGEITNPDGRVFQIRGCPVCDDEGTLIGLMEYAQDVTEQKQAEKGLQAANAYNRTLIESSIDPLVTISPGGRITDVNAATEEITGLSRGELIGTDFCGVFTNPEKARAGYRRAFSEGNVRNYPLEIRHAGGGAAPVLCNATVYRDEHGEAVGVFAAARDVAELKLAEDALRLANRKLHLLSSITRHDILNTMMVHLGYLTLARDLSRDPTLSEYLQRLETSARTVQRLIEFTREYERLGAEEAAWHSISGVLARVSGQQDLPVLDCCAGLSVYADPMIEKAFYTLMDNTVRHGGPATGVRVTFHASRDGGSIIWEDDGVGIPEDLKQTIFERGFGRNTGLGLFLAREILAITGMAIRETGICGEGARFEIHVPQGGYRSEGEEDGRER
ncbi:MAG: PAS domain-containing protein, partial [Methanomicrobiaceae archaeon]|nr:PAS domain-containing protein [Methanomicrobiaceae archaeon]